MRILLLAAIAGLAGCHRAKDAATQEPHQTLSDFTLSQSVLDSPEWNLKAKSALLMEEKTQAELAQPSMEFFKKGKLITRLHSDRGVINTVTADLHLSNGVVVTSIEDNSVVKTDTMDYLSQAKKFRTDSAVTVTRPGGVLHGKGLEANSDLSEIRIFHQTSIVDKEPAL